MCYRYSPSRTESDEKNAESLVVKPKVLGKEQAKRRLMAFSLSKQQPTPVKKFNKTLTPKKDKPPNPNKSTGVQEQLKATRKAIEDEKLKMLRGYTSKYPNMERNFDRPSDHLCEYLTSY